MIRELSDRQSEVKELFAIIREAPDKSPEDVLICTLGYDDETITAAVLAACEMRQDPTQNITHLDLIWAGAYLDHLDTQGFEVRRKKENKSGRKRLHRMRRQRQRSMGTD